MGESKDMSFWDHLDDLRATLFRSAIGIVICMVGVFLCKSFVFDSVIFPPRTSDFMLYRWLCKLGELFHVPDFCPEPFCIDIININLASQFFVHMSTSFWIGLIIAFPYVVYQLWLFISPALYDHEKRNMTRAFLSVSALFYIGVVVGYIFVFPLTIKFLGTYKVSEMVPNQISLNSYIGMLTSLVLIMGLVFEMPVLAYVLSRLGLLSRKFLKKYRRHAVVVLLFAAAIITPSADAFTMFMVAIPLYMLYEFSILVCVKEKPEEDEKSENVVLRDNS